MTISKTELRHKFRNLRNKLSKEKIIEFSSEIANNLVINLLPQLDLKNITIACYQAFNKEVEVSLVESYCKTHNIIIAFPKIKNDKSALEFIIPKAGDEFISNATFKGLREPYSGKKIEPEIILVPLLAFDKNLNRLGYGAGFYDKTIAKLRKQKNIITIGLAYDFQMSDDIIEINKFDQKLDYIVTQSQIYYQ